MLDLTPVAIILCGLSLIGMLILVWSILIAAARADRQHEKAWKNKKRRGS